MCFMNCKMNSVDSLLNYPFSRRSMEEKIEVKRLGRLTPDLNINQKAKGGKNCSYTRKFHRSVYENSWICGCEIRNALFCFPCLLFGNSDSNSWSRSGVTDLGHLSKFIKQHKDNSKHLHNVLNLNSIGSVSVAAQLSRAYHDAKLRHNEQVEKNRYVLSKIIDCIKFCGAFELALRGHDESDSSENPGIFRGLIDFVTSLDNAVREHMESNQVFKGTSKTIQNELLDCMLEVCREIIMQEMKEADFVALMADETTDISNETQLALVFRYEHKGQPYERFWGFLKPEGQNADAISDCILNEVNPLFKDKPERVIAQTFDGASVMSGATGGVQAKIKEHYPNAHFVHCYAHQLNLIMERAASQNQSARVFFLDLAAFPAYFSRSPQRLSALESVVARRIPSCSATRWNFKSRTVNTIFENKESLKECLLELEKMPNNKTCHGAAGLRRYLEDEEFLYWLTFFSKIMPHVDILYNQLQARSIDPIKARNAVTHFTAAVKQIRESTSHIHIVAESSKNNKRRKLEGRDIDAKEVCDRITQESCDRFKSLSHLDAANLLNSAKFMVFSENFPEMELEYAVKYYSTLDKSRLKTELRVLYERQDFRNTEGAVPLLQHLLSNNLQDTFCEITKLLKILVTTPMTTAEPERCFSSLARIKTFLRNTMSQERLTALAMLSIEKKMVSGIDAFNTKVIDKFCSRKERRMDFIFRY